MGYLSGFVDDYVSGVHWVHQYKVSIANAKDPGTKRAAASDLRDARKRSSSGQADALTSGVISALILLLLIGGYGIALRLGASDRRPIPSSRAASSDATQ
jgi:hypothetical protein